MSSDKLNANRAVSLSPSTPWASEMSLRRLSGAWSSPVPSRASIRTTSPPIPTTPFLRLPSFRLWNLPLPMGSAPLSSPRSDRTEGQSPCTHRSYLQALLPLSAARSQHTGGSEASRSLPRTRKPSGLLMLLRCLCAGQRQESGARRAKLLAASKEVLEDAPYPKLRLDAGRHPASQRAAQLGWEGGRSCHPSSVPCADLGKRDVTVTGSVMLHHG